jgi:hypothetical protein
MRGVLLHRVLNPREAPNSFFSDPFGPHLDGYRMLDMYFPLIALILSVTVSEEVRRGPQNCPAVWNDISKDLTEAFRLNGHCNDDARSAIRIAFKDCFPDGGCDGSIFLSSELLRPEHENVGPTVYMLGTMAEKYQVGVADIIQFAAGKRRTLTSIDKS